MKEKIADAAKKKKARKKTKAEKEALVPNLNAAAALMRAGRETEIDPLFRRSYLAIIRFIMYNTMIDDLKNDKYVFAETYEDVTDDPETWRQAVECVREGREDEIDDALLKKHFLEPIRDTVSRDTSINQCDHCRLPHMKLRVDRKTCQRSPVVVGDMMAEWIKCNDCTRCQGNRWCRSCGNRYRHEWHGAVVQKYGFAIWICPIRACPLRAAWVRGDFRIKWVDCDSDPYMDAAVDITATATASQS